MESFGQWKSFGIIVAKLHRASRANDYLLIHTLKLVSINSSNLLQRMRYHVYKGGMPITKLQEM